MTDWIPLTRPDGRLFMVRVNAIDVIEPADGLDPIGPARARIQITGTLHFVAQSPSEILNIIKAQD